MNDMTQQPKRRRPGRKPLGERPMTAAQRMQRTRDRQREKGMRSFLVKVSSPYRELLEELATANETSAAREFTDLVEGALAHYMVLRKLTKALQAAGYNEAETAVKLQSVLHAPVALLKQLEGSNANQNG